jgi:mannose-1-phosphate guanylyltransferase
MAVLTADQIIKPIKTFRQALKDALKFINNNPEELLTFGIQPSLPSTQLGYVKCSNPEKIKGLDNPVYKVDEFKEKPDPQTAKLYYESGRYFWNSGMFVWKARTIREKIKQLVPESHEPLENIKKQWNGPNREKVLEENFAALPKISIDYAVLEKTSDIRCIRLDCRWMDMGSFAALYDFIRADENNNLTVAGLTQLLDCSNTIVVTEQQDHLITGIGLENLIIAHSSDATLVCSREQAHRIKELLQEIEREDKAEFL